MLGAGQLAGKDERTLRDGCRHINHRLTISGGARSSVAVTATPRQKKFQNWERFQQKKDDEATVMH
jgi:hypothetical protein